ncbi:COG1835 Predicted acyltransferases [Methylophilaceae bacterium]
MGSLERNSFSFIEFYVRRINRIFPALLLVLIVCFAFGWFALLADEYKQLGKHIAGGAGFISNYLFWGESGYFDNAAETKPLLHLWSLGIEEQFYIVWPLLLWFVWKKKFNLLTVTLLVAFISFGLNIAKVNGGNFVDAFYSPQTRFWELLIGSILAYTTLHHQTMFASAKHQLDIWLGKIIYAHVPEANGKTLRNVQSILGATFFAIGFVLITSEGRFPGWWAMLPTLGAVLIISAGTQAWFNRVVLSNKLLVWFGLISFPLYLWHWPLLSFARIVQNETPSREIRIAAVLMSIVLAWLTYKLIEKPIRFGGQGKRKGIALVILMCVVGYIGYNSFQRDGLKFRNANSDHLNHLNDFSFPPKFRHLCPSLTASLDSGQWCNDGNIDKNPSIVLLGDSYATSYSQLLLNLNNEFHFSFKQYGVGQCPPLLDFGPKVCSDGAKEYYARIVELPTTKTVILAGAWQSYVNGKNYNWLGNDPHQITTPLEFRLAFDKTLKYLVGLNKKIIIFHAPPTGALPRSCIVRPLGLPNKNNCNLPKVSAIANDGASHKIINEILASYPQVNSYDPFDALCNNEQCAVMDGNQILYIDGGHMSAFGGKFLATRDKEKLMNLILE